jgi:transposase-like protein
MLVIISPRGSGETDRASVRELALTGVVDPQRTRLSKLLLDVEVFSRRGTDPAAAFLHRLTENHELSTTEFLVDGMGYLTALFRLGLSGHLDYTMRNHIEKWFQTLSMRIDRFHSLWRGSPPSARRWLRRFVYYYNFDRPNQAEVSR